MATEKENRHRAALALVALGPERAAETLRRLPQYEALAISEEVARIGSIDAATARDILADLAGAMRKNDSVAMGGPAYARDIVTRAFGAEVASMGPLPPPPRATEIFDYIERGRTAEIVRLIDTEPPTVIALMLAHVRPVKAADILSRLEPDARAEAGLRLAQLRAVPEKVVAMVDEDLRSRIAALLAQHVNNFDGVQLLAQVINSADQEMERELLREMMTRDPGLTEQLRDALFIFDDIARLGDRAIQEILKGTDTRVLATAMKNADEAVAQKIYKNLSERARDNLREEIEFLRGLRPQEIRDARKKVVAVVRQLEEAGAIVIERVGIEDGL
jgi:flagellar motor switch protein FliG